MPFPSGQYMRGKEKEKKRKRGRNGKYAEYQTLEERNEKMFYKERREAPTEVCPDLNVCAHLNIEGKLGAPSCPKGIISRSTQIVDS